MSHRVGKSCLWRYWDVTKAFMKPWIALVLSFARVTLVALAPAAAKPRLPAQRPTPVFSND